MPTKRKSKDGPNHERKNRKNAIAREADDWLVPSKASFDHAANTVLVISTPSSFSEHAFSNLSERLIAGDKTSALAVIQSLRFEVVTH